MTNTALVYEIFESIQGEGVYIGERQLFVRFMGCNTSCDYCDTPASKEQDSSVMCAVKDKKNPQKINNPVSEEELIKITNKFMEPKDIFHSMSVTGGEPLLQVEFLKSFLPKVKIKKYLETNGTLPAHLYEIIDDIDIIAMDFKLPSSTLGSSYDKEHKEFLKTASLKEVFVKAVYSKNTTPIEIEEMSKLIAEVSGDIPLVLQPVFAARGHKTGASGDQALIFHKIARKNLNSVRVIGQGHKLLGHD